VPVVPVGQWGAQHFLDVYGRRFRPLPRKRITISAGAPVDLSDFAGSAPSSAVLHEMTDRIMLSIRDLVAEIRGEQPPAEFYRRPAAKEGQR
jgi:1-acyl-sn-glycerol-3-phosphate acyltransferase